MILLAASGLGALTAATMHSSVNVPSSLSIVVSTDSDKDLIIFRYLGCKYWKTAIYVLCIGYCANSRLYAVLET